MLRQSLARSAWRTGRVAANVSRSFATTPQRHAEVELTIGKLALELRAIE
jgi:NADH dehydrogenase (ubiquinone) Fe-S protein 1